MLDAGASEDEDEEDNIAMAEDAANGAGGDLRKQVSMVDDTTSMLVDTTGVPSDYPNAHTV